ncbi:hypothetical protein KKA09_00610 [Patescibacteria group bacterium]|nr:hypothetical protein [Patescibacteria group bacterium]
MTIQNPITDNLEKNNLENNDSEKDNKEFDNKGSDKNQLIWAGLSIVGVLFIWLISSWLYK